MPKGNTVSKHDWPAAPVDTFEVAPHRYRYDDPLPDDDQSFEDWKASRPYNPGEVVYACKPYGEGFSAAYIVHVWRERDSIGGWRNRYRVLFPTTLGLWSKRWTYVWSGHVQRGYARAGLAPDVPLPARREA